MNSPGNDPAQAPGAAAASARPQVESVVRSAGVVSLAVLISRVSGLMREVVMARLMQSLLYQVQPGDLGTFVIVPLVLIVVALLATALPAYRAMRVSPLVALRSE